MTTGTLTRDQAVRDGFAQLVHAEWTKFRTVRGWVIAMIVAAMVIVGLGYFIASGNVCGSGPFPGQPYTLACTSPIGPGGEAVTDEFYLVHRPLAGNGSIAVRVTALAGVPGTAGLQPWSKAGIIVTEGTRPGSGYAAMMVTGGHGVRMQWDYTQDVAGLAGKVSASNPRWLRLTRDGDTDHRLRLRRRHALDRSRHGYPGRAADGDAGRAVRHLPEAGPRERVLQHRPGRHRRL